MDFLYNNSGLKFIKNKIKIILNWKTMDTIMPKIFLINFDFILIFHSLLYFVPLIRLFIVVRYLKPTPINIKVFMANVYV